MAKQQTGLQKQEGTFQRVGECLYRYSSNGIYYALVKSGRKQIRRSLKTKDRKLAERRLADFRAKIERTTATDSGANGRTARILFNEVAAQWLDTAKATMKPSSALRREGMIKNLNKTFGPQLVRTVTRNDCEAWARLRIPQCSASTYNKELETLHLVLEFAVREGLILDNPSRDMKRRKQPKAPILIPSKDQFQELLKTIRENPRNESSANLVKLLAYSGTRLGEAREILWKDINFKAGSFTVTGGALGTKNHEARIVPLFPALRDFLENLHERTHPKPTAPVAGIASAKKSLAHACKVADLLNDRVMPLYEESDMGLLRILTDRGTEYCGKPEQHDYQLYLAMCDIDHTRTKAKSPQTNGICERFHKTLLQEFYQVAFRKKVYGDIEALQKDLDDWMHHYNQERTHQGKMCCGRTPWQTWSEAKHLWKEKVTDINPQHKQQKIA